jgi:hypothetical protein
MNFGISPLPALFCLGLLGALVGCSETIDFRFLDADSLRPIDVRAIINRRDSDYWSTSEDSVDGGGSHDGHITIPGIKDTSTWRTRIEFFEPGYYEAGVSAEAGRFTTFTRVPASVDPSGEVSSPATFEKDGAVLVKLWRAPAGESDLRLRDWPDTTHSFRATGPGHLEPITNWEEIKQATK